MRIKLNNLQLLMDNMVYEPAFIGNDEIDNEQDNDNDKQIMSIDNEQEQLDYAHFINLLTLVWLKTYWASSSMYRVQQK